jgi:hypothetical protein
MSDPQPSPEPTPPAGAVPTPQPPPAGAVAVPPAPALAPAPAPETPDADAPTLSPAEIRALRNESQNLRRRLREFETAQEAAQRAAMSDVERLRADHDATAQRATALEAEVRGYRLRDAIEAAVAPATVGEGEGATANPLHGISPRLAARLIDPAALTYGDDGRPQPASVRRALQQALADYPEIRPAAPTTTPVPAPGAPRLPQQPPAGGAGGGGSIASVAAQQVQALHQQRASAPDPFKRS